MSNLRVAAPGLVALVLSLLLAACTQTGSGGLQPGSTEGTFALEVLVKGSGTVLIEDLDFECVDDCTARIGEGVTVELAAQADGAQGFAGWQGACSGTGTCSVTMDGDKSVTAVFADNVLVLDLRGDGQASVRIEPGEDCSSDCVRAYDSPVQVSLLVNPADDSEAVSLGGACGDSDRDDFCLVTVQGKVEVTATVNIRNFTLNVGVDGDGSVTGSGIDCPDNCSVDLKMGSSITLTAEPDNGWEFERWNGAGCGTNSRCTVRMNGDEEVTAVFRQRFLLAATVVGEGTVTSSPGGIDCSDECETDFSPGSSVSLSAHPNEGWTFTGWSGACIGTGGCTVTLDANKTVTATFEKIVIIPPPPDPILTVNVAGEGQGKVTGPGIDCGNNCDETYLDGDSVTLEAVAQGESAFAGWSGACGGSEPTCTFTINEDETVTATFDPPPAAPEPITLHVDLSGEGGGSVSGGPINCEPGCNATFEDPTEVTLTAAASSGSNFAGWSGACSGTDTTCTFFADGEHTVTARFDPAVAEEPPTEPEPERFVLTVKHAGDGSGSVTGDGIDCPTKCENSYDENVEVVLAAEEADDSTFEGWSGGCDEEDGASCTVVMNDDRTIRASFDQEEVFKPLHVDINGQGTVSSSPTGIDCPNDCDEEYLEGTPVTLVAVPGSDFEFESWTGCDSDANESCSVTMTMEKNVVVTFSPLLATFTLELQVMGPGTVAVDPAVTRSCSDSCVETYQQGQNVTLTAHPDPEATFAWDGACAVFTASDECSLTMDSNKIVTVTFDAGNGAEDDMEAGSQPTG